MPKCLGHKCRDIYTLSRRIAAILRFQDAATGIPVWAFQRKGGVGTRALEVVLKTKSWMTLNPLIRWIIWNSTAVDEFEELKVPRHYWRVVPKLQESFFWTTWSSLWKNTNIAVKPPVLKHSRCSFEHKQPKVVEQKAPIPKSGKSPMENKSIKTAKEDKSSKAEPKALIQKGFLSSKETLPPKVEKPPKAPDPKGSEGKAKPSILKRGFLC